MSLKDMHGLSLVCIGALLFIGVPFLIIILLLIPIVNQTAEKRNLLFIMRNDSQVNTSP